ERDPDRGEQPGAVLRHREIVLGRGGPPQLALELGPVGAGGGARAHADHPRAAIVVGVGRGVEADESGASVDVKGPVVAGIVAEGGDVSELVDDAEHGQSVAPRPRGPNRRCSLQDSRAASRPRPSTPVTAVASIRAVAGVTGVVVEVPSISKPARPNTSEWAASRMICGASSTASGACAPEISDSNTSR